MNLKKLRRSLHALKPYAFAGNKRSNAKSLGSNRLSFLDLPGEVRNEIYGYCLAQVDEPETLYWCNRILPPSPALACVCKLIRREYLTLFDSQEVDYKRFKHAKFGVVNLDFEPAAHFAEHVASNININCHNITITLIFTKSFQPAEAVRKLSALHEDRRSGPLFRMLGPEGNEGVDDLPVAVLDYRRFRRTRLWYLIAFHVFYAESRFEKLVAALQMAVGIPFQRVMEIRRGGRRWG